MKTPQPRNRKPTIITVSHVRHLTPNMIRVTFAGPEVAALSSHGAGDYCKLFLPQAGQSMADFERQLEDGPRPDVRTYTVRQLRASQGEMDIDFVDHGENGPASAWAMHAKTGSFCGLAGPNPLKRATFDADYFIVAADMSALPMAAATLEALPKDAIGTALFEIETEADKQAIDAPAGVTITWLVSDDPACPGPATVAKVLGMEWPTGQVKTCIAGESTMAKTLREYILGDKGVPRENAYISGYWKLGLMEDEHKIFKSGESRRG